MTKSLLISIQPQHLLNILNGDKTYEVRKKVNKDVLEALDRGETVEAYLYCTKGKPLLFYKNGYGHFWTIEHKNQGILYDKEFDDLANATIPAKVVIDGYEKIDNEPSYEDCYERYAKQSCMTFEEWYQYFTWSKTGGGYALHISKLEILDEVMKLNDFVTWDDDVWHNMTHWKQVTKAPKSMISVWVK